MVDLVEEGSEKMPTICLTGLVLIINSCLLQKAAEVPIGSLAVSGKTKWEILDNIVRKIFKVSFRRKI